MGFQKVLETIEKEGLQTLVKEVSHRLHDILQEGAADHPKFVTNIRGQGTVIAFDSETPALRDELFNRLRNNGVLVGVNGTQSIRFRPALNFNLQHATEFEDVFWQTLK